MRCYTSTLKKSAEDPNIPRVELNEVGPVMELELRRRQFAPDDLFKFATRVPKEAKV